MENKRKSDFSYINKMKEVSRNNIMTINDPNHSKFLVGRKKAADPNNPNSVNNPNHPDYGKGARIANTNRRKNSPKYNFINIVSNIIELNADAIYMAEKYNLTAHYFRMLGKGKIIIYKDWELYNE